MMRETNDGGTVGTNPPSFDDTMGSMLADLFAGENPEKFATRLVTEFVLKDRQEQSAAALKFLNTPTDVLVMMLRSVILTNSQAQVMIVDTKGPEFLNSIKTAASDLMKADVFDDDNIHDESG